MKFDRRAGILSAAVAGAALIAASAANGQEDAMAMSGEFALTLSLVETASGDPVAIGPSQMALAVNQVAHLFNDEGDGAFLNYASGNCASLQVVDVESNTIEIDGYCSYRDADGDWAFEHFATDGAVDIAALTMNSEWTGGTGKYAELSGTFTTTLSATIQDGDVTLVGGRKTGSYAIGAAEPMEEAEPTPAEPETPAEAEAPAEPETPAEPEAPAEPETPAADAPMDDEALLAALMDEGDTVFHRTANCANCHGDEGQGGFGPTLAGNDYLAGVGGLIGIILGGFEEHGMPAFANALDDRQVAAVATFVRNSWGNDYGLVREAWVATRR